MINTKFLTEVLQLNDFICSYEEVESIDSLFDSFNENILTFRTNVDTSPNDGSYVDRNKEISLFELNQYMLFWLLTNNYNIKEELTKTDSNVSFKIEVHNNDISVKQESFYLDKEYLDGTFNHKVMLDKLTICNNVFIVKSFDN